MRSISPSWEVAMYTGLLLSVWLLLRLIVNSLTGLWKFMVERFDTADIKVDLFLNDVSFAVSYWTERGARPYQEDRFQALRCKDSESSLYGVFDGHGGAMAAQYCKEKLLSYVCAEPDWEKNIGASLSRAFFRVDAEFSQSAREKNMNDGSTAVVAVVTRTSVVVANAGDSRAIIVQRGGKVKAMSDDHRPERKDEEARIRGLGGTLRFWGRWRVEGVLAVSRSIGDVSLQPFVTCEPEICEKRIEAEDEYLVLASDGLWDVLHNEDVASAVLNHSKDFVNVAKSLCVEAAIMGSADNVTVLVVDLKRRATAKGSETTTASVGQRKR